MLKTENVFHAFHEIKNSVTFIGSSLQLLEKNHPDIKDDEYFIDLMAEMNRLKSMIINVSKDIRIKDELKSEPLNPEHLLHSIHSIVHSMEVDDFYVQISIAENMPAIIADEFRLKSVIINLITNSYEAMGKNGTVFLRAFADETQAYIELQDFGGGILKEQETRLFEPFYTSKENGSGLGLAIAKKFMLEMNGLITYESRPGDGCTFRLALPIHEN